MNFFKELFEEQVIPLSLLVDHVYHSIKLILFLDLVHEISKNQFYVFLKFQISMCIKRLQYPIFYYFILYSFSPSFLYFLFLFLFPSDKKKTPEYLVGQDRFKYFFYLLSIQKKKNEFSYFPPIFLLLILKQKTLNESIFLTPILTLSEKYCMYQYENIWYTKP